MVSLTNPKGKLTVVMLGDRNALARLQDQLSHQCAFEVCRHRGDAERLQRSCFAAVWIVESRFCVAIDDLKQQGQFVVVWDNEYDPQHELSSYQAGAMYACGPLESEWLQALLGLPSEIEGQAADEQLAAC